jgi:adenylate cyclase
MRGPTLTNDPGSEYHLSFEPCAKRVTVVFNGVEVADSRRALVLRETRLPPVYYLPREDVRMDLASPTEYRTHCPFKGDASYWTLTVGDRSAENAIWSYEDPLPEAEPLRGLVAFYRNRMEAWYEEGERVSIDAETDTHAHGNPHVDWLMRDAWEASSTPELLARLARHMASVGVPVTRMALLVRTLHPQVMGTAHFWSHKLDAVESFDLSHSGAEEERFLSSPLVPIFAGRGGIRRRLEGPDARLDFPILRDLKADGATDYAAMPLAFSDGQIHALTLATNRPGGFPTESLGHLHEILPLVSRLVEVHTVRSSARTLLETYLGTHSGARVLDGLVRRGDGEDIPAVVVYCDLRRSTALSESLPRSDYLRLLNEFFESAAGPVLQRGGEVLKFIGDGVLAIFPVRDQADAPEQALAAVRDTRERIAALNRERESRGAPTLGVALAIHHGDVNYGNVGAPGRLDFTVTGPVVNEVARLERLSKQLEKPVLTSASFASLTRNELVSVGTHQLRGTRAPQEVFTLPECV